MLHADLNVCNENCCQCFIISHYSIKCLIDRQYSFKYKTDIVKRLLQVGADVIRQEDCGLIPLYSVTNWNSVELIWLSLENRSEH